MTKILLVEDDKSLQEVYSVRIRAEGYEVVTAGDGEEALALAIKERPDLIISDVMMPKISGFDMLDILRSTTETRDVKVIMMTALSSEDQRARGEALGADRYLVKSQVGIEDVVRTVHEVLADGSGGAAIAPAAPVAAAPSEPAPVVAPEPIVVPPAPVAEPVAAPVFTPAPEPTAPIPVAAPVPTPVAPAPITPPTPVAPEPVAAPLAPAPIAPSVPTTPIAPVPTPSSVPPIINRPVAVPPVAAAPAPITPPTPVAPEPVAAPLAPAATDADASFSFEPLETTTDLAAEQPAPSPEPAPETPAAPLNTDLAARINQELAGQTPPQTPVA